jgi:hypothetical protein
MMHVAQYHIPSQHQFVDSCMVASTGKNAMNWGTLYVRVSTVKYGHIPWHIAAWSPHNIHNVGSDMSPTARAAVPHTCMVVHNTGMHAAKYAVSHMPSGHICNIILGRQNAMYGKRPASNGPRYMFVLRGDTRTYSAPQLVPTLIKTNCNKWWHTRALIKHIWWATLNSTPEPRGGVSLLLLLCMRQNTVTSWGALYVRVYPRSTNIYLRPLLSGLLTCMALCLPRMMLQM